MAQLVLRGCRHACWSLLRVAAAVLFFTAPRGAHVQPPGLAPPPRAGHNRSTPSGGRLAAAGDMLAFAGATGWKQRSPFLQAGRISGGEQAAAAEQDDEEAAEKEEEMEEEDDEEGGDWQARLRTISTGFYDPVRRPLRSVCMPVVRWSAAVPVR